MNTSESVRAREGVQTKFLVLEDLTAIGDQKEKQADSRAMPGKEHSRERNPVYRGHEMWREGAPRKGEDASTESELGWERGSQEATEMWPAFTVYLGIPGPGLTTCWIPPLPPWLPHVPI